jgi:2-amino-4-hydroxy-6-hydroxymethyldihydropteridine diphosphokinase
VIDSDELSVPHPLMAQRRFVLVPFCEIAPRVVHPVLHKTAEQLLRKLDDPSRVKRCHAGGQDT